MLVRDELLSEEAGSGGGGYSGWPEGVARPSWCRASAAADGAAASDADDDWRTVIDSIATQLCELDVSAPRPTPSAASGASATAP